MKYDVLEKYKKFLSTQFQLTTVNTYYNRMDNLLEGQDLLNPLENLNMEMIFNNLAKIKYKNYFSQSKNALLYFLMFYDIPLDKSFQNKMEGLEKNLVRKNRKLMGVQYSDVKNRINHIRNRKLRLSYQVMLSTGLRVSELSQIKKSDCVVTDKEIIFCFMGKGGRKEQSVLTRQEYSNVYRNLIMAIEKIPDDKNIFYSSNYLQQSCGRLGFHCHDLRRLFAKLECQKTKSKEKTKEKLRHTDMKTTEIYLNSKVKLK